MTTFIVVAVVMTAIAIAWIVVPVLRGRASATGVQREASNVAILRDQLKELEVELGNGVIGREQYEQARRELEQRVLEESMPGAASAAPTVPRSGRRTAYAIAAAIPIAALALYALWGNRDAFDPIMQQAGAAQHSLSPDQVNQMIARVVERLEKEPKNVEAWVILARTYYATQRYADAAKAFERATQLLPTDASLLADYADALGATQGGLEGKPLELIEKALKADPTHWKALALAGTAAFDRKDYKRAITYWEDLKRVIPPNVGMAQTLDASIAEARKLGGLPAGAPVAQASSPPLAAPAKAASVGPSKLEGTVKLSPQLIGKASPSDAVFIFARPAEGPRMPLAIIKRQVKDLPASFALDDSMAMTPNAMLSSYPQVVVGARISRSGQAMPQSGDLEGVSAPVKPGATGLTVVIDRTLP